MSRRAKTKRSNCFGRIELTKDRYKKDMVSVVRSSARSLLCLGIVGEVSGERSVKPAVAVKVCRECCRR